MRLEAGPCVVRPLREGDEPSLARHANNRGVWRNVRDRFPHPYSLGDAVSWLATVTMQEPPTHFGIEVDGEIAGGIGFTRREDVERFNAEIGYWLGEAVWGRGVATAALQAFVDWTFASTDLVRLEALVFEWNPASCRVLEKCGFVLEGRLRRAVFKDGQQLDGLLYARLAPEDAEGTS